MTNAPPAKFALAHNPKGDSHFAPGFHPERPERAWAAHRGVLSAISEPIVLASRDATLDELVRCHSEEYLSRLEQSLKREHGFLDGDTFFSMGTHAAAWSAAGSAVAAIDALMDERANRVFLLARPPGHHATKSRSMGFCLLNNVAIAAAHARARGAKRVAIVDWDVHHGNGTQDIFYHDPSVLFLSLHQWPLYPGTGQSDEVGLGDGRGFTVNLPLPTESDGAVYRASFARVVRPILEQYAPDLLIVSAGFDAHERDPLATMRLKTEDYQWMMQQLVAVADHSANGKILVALEGGYDLRAIEQSVQVCVSELLAPTAIVESSSALSGEAKQTIDAVIRSQRQYWRSLG